MREILKKIYEYPYLTFLLFALDIKEKILDKLLQDKPINSLNTNYMELIFHTIVILLLFFLWKWNISINNEKADKKTIEDKIYADKKTIEDILRVNALVSDLRHRIHYQTRLEMEKAQFVTKTFQDYYNEQLQLEYEVMRKKISEEMPGKTNLEIEVLLSYSQLFAEKKEKK